MEYITRFRQLAEENRMLRQRVAELEAAQIPVSGWGHSGPCLPGCNCDLLGFALDRAGQNRELKVEFEDDCKLTNARTGD